MSEWQTWAAPAVVILTAFIMIWRSTRKKESSDCNQDCGCDSDKS